MNDPIRRGTLEMTSAMLICGTIGWLVLLSGQPVLDVVFWRCVFGFAALLVACAVLGFLRRGSLGREAFLLALLSGVFIVGNWVLLFASYSRASIAIGTAVYNVQPFMLVGLGAAFLGEKVTARKLGWLGLSFAGMLAIVSAHGDSDAPRGDYLFGILLALAAALLYAFAALIVKRLQGTPPHLIALIQVGTGVLMLAPLANLAELPRGVAPWASLATLGIVHTGLMYAALRRHSEIADGADRCVVLHLSGRGDPGGLAGLRTSPEPGAVAWRGRHPACRGGHAAGLERAPAGAGSAARLRRRGKEKAPRRGRGFSTAISADQLPKTLKRSLSAMKAFSPAGAAMAPKGICARSFQLSGRFQVLWVWASTSGL